MSGGLYEEIDLIFHPRSMAAVGVSEHASNMGLSFLIGYQKFGFKGQLYAIHPTKEISRFPTYRSLQEVPGPVDHVKVAVPARAVPDVIRDCAAKGVRCATVFSSGFRESGTAFGEQLEEEVVAIAREGGVRIIGPNCMGLYCPETGLSIRGDMPPGPDGKISLIAQSGGMSISTVLIAEEKGIGLARAVSYGNESDLGPPEFLHYYTRDPKTEVICLYIEGTRRPFQLREALADAASKKPVIVLKGGSTEVGNRAVASHTGAMTGSSEVWRAVVSQSGAVMVEDIESLIDTALLYSLSRPPAGHRIGLLTVSGGFGVFATDQVARAGFEMPGFSEPVKKALLEFIDSPGTSVGNPVDMAARFFQPENFPRIFKILDREENFDAYILICAIEYLSFIGRNMNKWSEFMTKALVEGMKELKKPIYVVFHHTFAEQLRLDLERQILAAGFPVFPTMPRCLSALSRTMKAKK